MRLPSGLKRSAADCAVVPAQNQDRLAGRGIEDARCLVDGTGDNARAVRTEGCGEDAVLMACEAHDPAGLGQR